MTKLKIDWDSRRRPDLERIFYILRFLDLHATVARITRSRHLGWHILVIVRESLHPAETVAAQCLCGSDSKRELFNLARVFQLKNAPIYWRDKWNVLYEAD